MQCRVPELQMFTCPGRILAETDPMQILTSASASLKPSKWARQQFII